MLAESLVNILGKEIAKDTLLQDFFLLDFEHRF